MDNVCHTLVGGALSRAGFDRRTPLATATMMIGANLPDVDVVAVFFGTQLAVRRGITHGVPALIVLPFLLTAAMMLWDRHVRRRRDPSLPPAIPRELLLLSAVSILTHPFLDWMNTYGMRWLMPIVDRWYYADTLFIVDPWIWLALAIGWFGSRRAKSVHPARVALAGTVAYIAVMMTGTIVLRSRVILESGRPMPLMSRGLMVAPVPANPFARQVVLTDRGAYRVARFSFLDGEFTDRRTIPINRGDPAIAVALIDPDVQRFMRWARFPFFTVQRNGAISTVHIADARYSIGPVGGWASVSVTVPTP